MKSKRLLEQQQNAAVEEAFHTEMQKGDERSKAGWFNDALQSYHAAIEHANTLSDRVKIADAQYKTGVCQVKLNRHDQALASFRAARILYHRNKRLDKVVSCLTGESYILHVTGPFQKSLETAKKALAMSRIVGNKASTAMILWNISNIYSDLKKYQKALSKMESALQLTVEVGNEESAENIRIDLARIHISLCNHRQALQMITETIDRAVATGNDYRHAFALFRRGLIHIRTLRFDDSWNDNQKACELFRQLGNNRLIVSSLSNLASISYLRGDLDAAAAMTSEAIDIALTAQVPSLEIHAIRALAEINYAWNEKETAFKQINRTIDYFRQTNNQSEENTSIYLRGEFYARSGNREFAYLDFAEVASYAAEDPNSFYCAVQLYLCSYWFAYWGMLETAEKHVHLANRQPISKRNPYLKLTSMIPKCMIRLARSKLVEAGISSNKEKGDRTNLRVLTTMYNKLCAELDALQIAPSCNIGFYRTHLNKQLKCTISQQ
ncbi:MAG: tetratricopeptide repeat protein [bacterium]|nr:tetratricopeptide repeat protein [bacterium]